MKVVFLGQPFKLRFCIIINNGRGGRSDVSLQSEGIEAKETSKKLE